jgi:hypothetical protein
MTGIYDGDAHRAGRAAEKLRTPVVSTPTFSAPETERSDRGVRVRGFGCVVRGLADQFSEPEEQLLLCGERLCLQAASADQFAQLASVEPPGLVSASVRAASISGVLPRLAEAV